MKKKQKTFSIKKYINKIKKSKVKFSLSEMLTIVVIAILVGILLGSSISYSTENITVTKIPEEMEEFITTYNNVYNNYYGKVKKQDLINAALKGMIESLDDPYSQFLEDDISTAFNESVDGEYVGIGTTVSYDGKYVKVTSMFNNSPAKKAGIKVGDQIIEIDGKKVEGLSLNDISKLIKGNNNTNVEIVVLRGEKEKKFKIKRKKITVPSVSSKTYSEDNQKIGYISIDVFSSNADKQFEKELKKLEKKKINSLIIDVRNNPGGYLVEVTNILEHFIEKGKVIYQIEKKGINKKIKDSTKDKRTYKIVVLINNTSASASEILATSLKNVYHATLVGVKTYGKGTVQSAYQLTSGATLKYTTQKWLTSKGKWLNEEGVAPDYEVNLDNSYFENPIDENDNQLQKALEILGNQKEEN